MNELSSVLLLVILLVWGITSPRLTPLWNVIKNPKAADPLAGTADTAVLS